MRKKISVAIFIFLIFLFTVFAFFYFIGQGKDKKNVAPTPFPVPTDINIDYSKLYLLKPGKSTLSEVKNINGEPFSSSTFGDETTLYYKTPSEMYKNSVVLKNGIVYYVIENIFGNYRGFYDNYVSNYGQPDMVLYSKTSDYPWYIFLKKGVGVQSASNNEITAFMYFVPQNREDFIGSIAKELGLSSKVPVYEEKFIPAP